MLNSKNKSTSSVNLISITVDAEMIQVSSQNSLPGPDSVPPCDDDSNSRNITTDAEHAKRALRSCFTSALRTDTVIQVFGPYIASQEFERVKQAEVCARRFREYYNSFDTTTSENPDIVLKQRRQVMEHLAEYIYSLTSPRYISSIFKIILNLVTERAFHEPDLELFCRRLVESTQLTLKKPHHWYHVFELIYEVVQSVNYKVCQHLLINTLYKMAEILKYVDPNGLSGGISSSRREIMVVARVIDRLLDRERPLLPAYISLNEIRQIFERDPPFHPLSKSMAKLEASFKPLSSFITLKCHQYIYPFVQYQTNGISNMNFINWQLDPASFCWNYVKQNKLPFPHRDQCQRQYRLLNYLMSQEPF